MFNTDLYISSLIELLKAAYKERLLYVGLQGSYLRGEANENSDIDIMVVVSDLSVSDLEEYKSAITALENYDKSCGFICGLNELKNWNPLELCHLLHTTKDYFGELAEFLPKYSENDVRNFVKMSLGNLYHEICHRYIHSPIENSVSKLQYTYRSVFFILQNLHYLKSGIFIATKKELCDVLSGDDKLVLETAINLSDGKKCDFEDAFSLLFGWCKETLMKI